MTELHDMHCHLDFMSNGEDVARDAAQAGSLLFATTVTPDGYVAARERFGRLANVRVGLGLHPWWVTSDADDAVATLIDLARNETFIGEVGLDFGKRHEAWRVEQVEAFTRIAETCGEAGGKVLSIHSARAAREVLDILHATGAAESCTCIFHWYSGPSDQLKRAIEAGCYFSVNRRMLATGKGREYVKAIPVHRLLLETDAPPDENEPYSWETLRGELQYVDSSIALAKGADAPDIIASTSKRIMSLAGAR